jgi:hypothetical protein
MHHGMTKLVRQSHSVTTNAHLSMIANATSARNCYDSFAEFGLGVYAGKFRVVDNDKNEFPPAVKS